MTFGKFSKILSVFPRTETLSLIICVPTIKERANFHFTGNDLHNRRLPARTKFVFEFLNNPSQT